MRYSKINIRWYIMAVTVVTSPLLHRWTLFFSKSIAMPNIMGVTLIYLFLTELSPHIDGS